MGRSKLMRIILIAGSLWIIVGVSLMTWMLSTADDRSVISVSLNEGDSKPIKFLFNLSNARIDLLAEIIDATRFATGGIFRFLDGTLQTRILIHHRACTRFSLLCLMLKPFNGHRQLLIFLVGGCG